jgi:hypothetical protein
VLPILCASPKHFFDCHLDFQQCADKILLARWECLRTENDIDTVAAQTTIALAGEEELPDDVLDALDKLLSSESRKRARAITEVVQYLRQLAADDREKARKRS